MKAVRGYKKSDYLQDDRSPIVKQFETIAQAAEYLAQKYGQTVDYMTRSILNDTNCDAIYFEDDSVIIYEF